MSDIYGDFGHPDSEGNQNNLVQIQSGELAQAFMTEFNLMWGDGNTANFGGWFGNKHFSQANNYLRGRGVAEIAW